jgi:SWI/SNF-related matrix-associated actin-dependent regulator of chromatin subfamily A member 5
VYKLVSQGTVEEQMMGRIQKKLYLSAKVTEAMEDIHTKFGSLPGKGKGKRSSNSTSDDNMPQLSTSQLMSLVRRGASAVSRPEINVSEMLSWDWETTVAKCKDQPADISVKKDIVQDAKLDEEEEKKWLTEMERVESSIFDGKKLAKRTASNKDIAQEFLDHSSRRVGKNTTVMVDGFAISKESMNCGEWEAVPTMAGKDPRLSEPKREKKAPIEHQSHCQVCLDGGDLHLCQLCPRSYHIECLDPEAQAKALSWQFNCPQHECHDCTQKTTDAGGMLYRCRWCERAYCEDCLDFDETTLVGDNLLEYELLDYPEVVQAFYIECPKCAEHFAESPGNKKLCDDLAEGWRLEHETVFGYAEIVNEQGRSTRAGSLTDATTVETPGVETPESEDDDDDESIEVEHPSDKKRKINAAGDDISPAKRVKMRV